jgi:hypothetical protein
MFTENKLFYTPKTLEELTDHIDQMAKASGNPAAVWTAVMMTQNFIAVELAKETDNDAGIN